MIRRSAPESKEEKTEYFYILIQSCSSYYFNLQYEKIDEIVKELESCFQLSLNFVSKLIFIFPYARFSAKTPMVPVAGRSGIALPALHTPRQPDRGSHDDAMAKTVTGFVHLWREEITISQKYFNESIEILGEKILAP